MKYIRKMKLSIITINYNNGKGLERTILSVINQSYKDYEFIVIDGNSTDDSKLILEKYKNDINYWVSEPDTGIYNAMNKGSRIAQGDYLNFLNSGDCFSNNHVLKSIADLQSDAAIITGCHKENGLRNVGKNGITFLDLYKWAVDHQASFIKRELCMKYPYDEKYKIVSDWKFFIQALILDNCSFEFTEQVIIDVESGGISETNFELDHRERDMVLKELFPERILADYRRLAKADSPLLELTPELNQTTGIQKAVYRFARLLLKLRKMF